MVNRHGGCSWLGMATSLQCIFYVLKNSDDPPRFYLVAAATPFAACTMSDATACDRETYTA